MIKLIVCVGKNGLIGDANPVGNGLLWHSKEELKFFNEKTKGHTVLFGKKTAEAVPLELIKKTRNVIILDFGMSIDDIINKYKNSPETLWICGGLSIYNLFMEKRVIDELHVSYLKPHIEVKECSKPLFFKIKKELGYKVLNSIEYNDFISKVYKRK